MNARTIHDLFLRMSRWPLEDLPTLLLLHGSGGSGALWEAQVRDLADVANVVAVDLAGHGRSEGLSAGTISDHAAHVARLVPALGVPSVIVGGLSLGGGVALQLLLDHADVVSGGVLVGTGARLRVMPMIFQAIEQDFEGFVQGLPRVAASPHTDPGRLKPVMDDILENGPAVSAADFRLCDAFDVMGRLGEIERPVLVLSGEHDALTPPKYARYLAEHIRGAQLVSVPRAGHLAPVEQPGAVNGAIRTWLAR